MTEREYNKLKHFAQNVCVYRGEYWCRGGSIEGGKAKPPCRYLVKNKCTHPANPKNKPKR